MLEVECGEHIRGHFMKEFSSKSKVREVGWVKNEENSSLLRKEAALRPSLTRIFSWFSSWID